MLTASNEYGSWKGATNYPWMNEIPGTQLVEPYKNTLLELSGPLVDDLQYKYAWEIPGYKGDLSGSTSKRNVFFTDIGIYTLTVYVVDVDDNAVFEFTTRLICK